MNNLIEKKIKKDIHSCQSFFNIGANYKNMKIGYI